MKHTQKGGSLLLTLIALVVMMLGTISIYKSAEGAVTTVGTYAFKEGSVHAANIAVNHAIAALNAKAEFNTDTADYFHIQRKMTSDGMPCATPVDTATTCLKADLTWPSPMSIGLNKASYVIERLCKDIPDLSDPSLNCLSSKQPTATGDKDAIFYRITVKVTGPNNTVSFVQVALPKQI